MVIRRRQTKTRISARQPSRQKKKPQFAAPPVIQPKVQRKTAKELPQLKTVIGRHPNPLERLRNSQSVQRQVERGQPNHPDTQQLESATRDAIQPISSASPTAEQPGATIQRERMESLPQEAMDGDNGLQRISPLHNETSSHNHTIQRKIVGHDGSDIWTEQNMDQDLAQEANDGIKMLVQMLHGADREISVDSYEDLVRQAKAFLKNYRQEFIEHLGLELRDKVINKTDSSKGTGSSENKQPQRGFPEDTSEDTLNIVNSNTLNRNDSNSSYEAYPAHLRREIIGTLLEAENILRSQNIMFMFQLEEGLRPSLSKMPDEDGEGSFGNNLNNLQTRNMSEQFSQNDMDRETPVKSEDETVRKILEFVNNYREEFVKHLESLLAENPNNQFQGPNENEQKNKSDSSNKNGKK